MGQPKLRDVATKADVSLSTASMALSGKGRISVEVRSRVLSAAEEIGYGKKPDLFSVTRKQYKYIGILHDEERAYEWNFIYPFIAQIESSLNQNGYFPVMLGITRDFSTNQIFKSITSSAVSAVFSIHYSNKELFLALEKKGIYVVIINNSNFQDGFYSVCVDDFQGAYEGTIHLIKLGHKNISYIEYKRPYFEAVAADRFVGFKKACDEFSLNFSSDRRMTIEFMDMEELHRKLKALFSKQDKPTALFAHDDYLAAHILVVLQDLGLKIPEDVSIIAPGDVLDYSKPFMPQITTMRINTALLGKIAGGLMMERINNELEDIHVLKVKQQLVERGSCQEIV